MKDVKPEVGMKVTYCMWSDREVYTIIDVSKSGRVITVQRDKKVALHKPEDLGFVPGGFSAIATTQDNQKWEMAADPTGYTRKFSLRKNGRWCEVGSNDRSPGLAINVASEFYDYNF
jgi:hypothetical protein